MNYLKNAEREKKPFVSIIVPAYNESKNIGYCLESLVNLNYPKQLYEIIIVDNGSIDNTISIAKKYSKMVYSYPFLTISALRNHGAIKAKGSVYAFIDADCVASPDWLKNAIKSLEEDYCITGCCYQSPSNAKWIEKAWFSQREIGRCSVMFINAGNLIVPAEIFIKIGGFNEKLITGEDYEFCMRARKISKIISDDSIKVVHLGNPKSLRQFLKREIWHGLGAFGSINIHRFDKPLIGTIVFFLLTIWQLIGIMEILKMGTGNLLIYASGGIFMLLMLTVIYRIKFVTSFIHSLQLIFLYYFYYLGRSISFIYILLNKEYRRKKNN